MKIKIELYLGGYELKWEWKYFFPILVKIPIYYVLSHTSRTGKVTYFELKDAVLWEETDIKKISSNRV